VVLAGGVEHMGHVPMNSPAKISELYGDPWPPALRERYDFVPQGESAELIAERWDIGRAEMDAFAVRSHRLAVEAVAAGGVEREVIPLGLDGGRRGPDQGDRPGTAKEGPGGAKTRLRGKDGADTARQPRPR